MTHVRIATVNTENERILTFDPETNRLEAETYMDGEGNCVIGFNLTAAQRRTLADLLIRSLEVRE